MCAAAEAAVIAHMCDFAMPEHTAVALLLAGKIGK